MRQAFACCCLAVLVWFVPFTASGQIPQTFTNLQVLPKDIPRAQLVATMRGFAGALGVRCTHCHVGPDDLQGMDFATDEKRNKRIARTMLRMVRTINADFVETLPAAEPVPTSPQMPGRQAVTCLTCHRRESKPPQSLPDILLATINTRGVPAAVEQYQRLRSEMMDAGLYDFREPALNIVATSLREQKRIDEALEILRLNAAMFPKSAMVQISLGDTAALKGDLTLAESSFKRALEIEPGNVFAMKSLASVRERMKKQ
jgi:tetratricopeptide (TPR) repeat protein